MSQLKIKDGNSWINIPAGGVGVPSGGNQGDVLVKSSSTDYATEWALPVSMKLLWTNPNPSSTFTPQTVQVDLSDYDLVALFVAQDASGTGFVYIAFVGDIISATLSPSGTDVLYTRTYTINTSGIDCGNGYWRGNVENNAMILRRIYGIKGLT